MKIQFSDNVNSMLLLSLFGHPVHQKLKNEFKLSRLELLQVLIVMKLS